MPDVIFTGATRNFSYPPEIKLTVAPAFTSTAPKELAVGDFNGDGKVDVLVSYIQLNENTPAPFRLMLGDGAGGFTDGTSAVFGANVPSGVFVRQLLTADFNGDGRLDVFASDTGFDAPPFPGFQNSLLLSSGATGFANATAQLPVLSDYSHSATTADVDGDGDLDIFVANLGSNPPYFLINDGHGAFTRDDGRVPLSNFASGQSPSTVLLFDADGDGRPDLLLGDVRGTSGSTILRNDGTGHFNSVLTVAPDLNISTTADALDVHAVDVNGDGRLDLVLLYSLNSGAGSQLQILINRPDGTFVDETSSRMAEAVDTAAIRRVQIVDLNGDGAPDIFIQDDSDRPVYLNDGSGHFLRMPTGFVPGNQFDDMAVADLNGDGRMDIFAVRSPTNVAVHLGLDPGPTQTGTDAADGFMGGPGGETMSGLGGDDVIFTGGGDDSVTAGAGNDTVVARSGHTYLRGDDGNDSIEGGSGFDDINGNKGADTIDGGSAGHDWLVGGQGDDLITGAQADILWGNLGNDTLHGGSTNAQLRGGQGDDSIAGGSGNEFISGDRGNDTESGGGGADIFHTFGDAGIDRVLDFNYREGDRVQLDPGTQFTVSQVGADTVINMTGGAQMTLVGVQLSTLPTDWIFGA